VTAVSTPTPRRPAALRMLTAAVGYHIVDGGRPGMPVGPLRLIANSPYFFVIIVLMK
jgi:hypothetical protein